MHQPVKEGDNNEIGPVEATACTVDATLVLYNNVYPGVLHIYDNGSYETLEVTGWYDWDEAKRFLLYEEVYKTGRTTGTTKGVILEFKERENPNPDDWPCILYKIIYTTDMSEGGDSGSPVYVKLGGHAALVGYLVGGNSSSIVLNVENLWDAFGVKPYVCEQC